MTEVFRASMGVKELPGVLALLETEQVNRDEVGFIIFYL
jgi:hypothetical protein